MADRQRGMTLIGMALIAAMVAVIGFGAVRMTPIMLNQMKVRQLLSDLKTDFDGQGPTVGEINSAIAKRLDIEMIAFPEQRDFKISKTDDGYRVNVSYEDRAPYFANLYLLAAFDNSVEIRR